MNYSFQINGVPRTGALAPYYGYSAVDLPDLRRTDAQRERRPQQRGGEHLPDQVVLPERDPVTSPTTANGPTNWNCNGVAPGARRGRHQR